MPAIFPIPWKTVSLALCLSLLGCAPHLRLDRQAAHLELRLDRITGTQFQHRIYRKGSACAEGRVHVYLEGDGLAWLPGGRIAADPTPPSSCLLPLMAMDPAPSVYLGRPCYHGLARTGPCHPMLWTQARYGETVLESMAAALGKLTDHSACRAVLIGFSGGGTLAMLLAARMPERIAGVVTLAGNLDIEAWTRKHGYTPLDRSLNPAHLPPLPAAIFQIHVAGDRDDNIPLVSIAHEAARQRGARLLVLPGMAHACPDEAVWRGILTGIGNLEQPPDRQKNTVVYVPDKQD